MGNTNFDRRTQIIDKKRVVKGEDGGGRERGRWGGGGPPETRSKICRRQERFLFPCFPTDTMVNSMTISKLVH